MGSLGALRRRADNLHSRTSFGLCVLAVHARNTVRQYTKWHWPALVFRVFACTMGFLLWWNNAAFFEAVLSNQLGVNVGIRRFIPLTPATAGIYGLLSDVLLDFACAKIPFLKGRIPGESVPETQGPSARG